MTPRRPRNDRRPWTPDGAAGPSAWLFGWHAVIAALENPARAAPSQLLATPSRARQLEARLGARFRIETADPAAIDRAVGRAMAHQGLAARIDDLAPQDLNDLAALEAGPLVMLDQVTDPQNVGAIFRSAAAFGAAGMILQDRHAPALAGVVAKAAAGAIERLPHARVANLARALERLERAGWRAVGLAADAPADLDEVLDGGRTVLVLGSEDDGLRRLVSEHCDVLARIPMSGAFESLNVAAAAAVALFAAQQARGR